MMGRSFRRLLSTPAFTTLCTLTLAVAIGANTAVFSLVDAALLRPLPYPEAERLVGLWHTAPGLDLPELPQSDATYLLYQQERKTFEGVAIYRGKRVTLTGGEQPERLLAAEVSSGFLQVLQVMPRPGRSFTDEEGLPGAAPSVLISENLWKRRFGSDPQILRRSVRVDGSERQVVGVLPAGFDFPAAGTDLWLPMQIDPAQASLGSFSSVGIARLAAGVTATRAETNLNRQLSNLVALFPGSEEAEVLAKAGFAARLRPFREDVVGNLGPTLWLLLAAVFCVLLIACANVANLLLVRGDERRREIAIRSSLGATRSRLIADALGESLVLALMAAVVGVLLALGALRLLADFGPSNLPGLAAVSLEPRVLAFTIGVSLWAALLFGTLPAARTASLADLASELRSGGRSIQGGSKQRLRWTLVGLQLALAVVLLTGSGLVLRSFVQLSHVDPGFTTRDLLTFQLTLLEGEYADDEATARFSRRAVETLRSLPGVEAAAVASSLPLSGSAPASGHEIEDHPLPANTPPLVLGYQQVSPGYFRTLGIPLRQGRLLQPADEEQRTGAVVISEALARHYWPQGNVLGKRLRPLGQTAEGEASWYTVVGVVGGVRNLRLTDPPGELIYYPLLGRSKDAWVPRQLNVVVRGASERSVREVRAAIAALGPNLPISDLATGSQLVERARSRMVFATLLFSLATLVALLLGVVGTYAFMAHLVGQRSAEFGVRMALGAQAFTIRWMIFRETLTIAVLSLAVGIASAALLTRWLGSLLFEVNALDPWTFAAVPWLLLAVVSLASYVPAERATRHDPLQLLR